jgi:DNA mismatch repair protein MutS
MLMLNKLIKQGIKLTPMFEQYKSIKDLYPDNDTILFYRMGDFYELFFEDAELASQFLNITLTHRGKLGDTPIPMAGVPHHSAAQYIERLTKLGKKIVICEQISDPTNQTKGILKREVTQVVSAALPFDLDKSHAGENYYLMSVGIEKDIFNVVFLDFTTGAFFGVICQNESDFLEKISLFSPKEIVTYKSQFSEFKDTLNFIQNKNIQLNYLHPNYFQIKGNENFIEKLIPNYKKDKVLRTTPHILNSVSAISFYVCSTQYTKNLNHICPFKLLVMDDLLRVSPETLQGLEILPPPKQNFFTSITSSNSKVFEKDIKYNCLLHFMDKTLTLMGSRELKYLFQTPSRNLQEINERLDSIEELTLNQELLDSIRSILQGVCDLERIMTKLSLNKISGQNLIQVAQTINKFHQLQKLLGNMKLFNNHHLKIEKLLEWSNKIILTINAELGASCEKGNFVNIGICKERDRLHKLFTNSEEALEKLESKYKEIYKISNLKIKTNNISGFFIEISKSHLSKIPANFQRKQTLVNAERFTTPELIKFETEVLRAKDDLFSRENEIFETLKEELKTHISLIQIIARALAGLDVIQSLSTVSQIEEFIRPQIVDKKIFNVEGAFHPILKFNLKEKYIGHSFQLNEEKFFGLITGPNMAGKTTVMREMAIIQFLTQIGCFVPAKYAEVGLCDYLFARIGAQDDILRGQSTFMVEMGETSEILRHASEKSMILMDEVGRGTSTFDGLSIAWSLVEHFTSNVKALTLFSTHYHELVSVVEALPQAQNFSIETAVDGDDVHFLYKIVKGGTEQSYGIYVAKLAGLPTSVISRAQDILKDLENTHPTKNSEAHHYIQDSPSKNKNKNTKKSKKAPAFKEIQLCIFPYLDESLERYQKEKENIH